MTYEVELKFALPDPADVLAALEELGAEPAGESIRQRDDYLAHPTKNFAETDEALRIRSTGERNVVTYKGPLVDEHTKTRREIEIAFADGEADRLRELFERLDFHPVRSVEKSRRPFRLKWREREFEVVFDEVTGLGSFLELETAAEEDDLDAAREAILALADRLGLEKTERRSYLAMLLERDDRS